MRQPLRSKGSIPQGRVSTIKSFPAPVGGWNARDALSAMKPTDAIALENWFPGTSYVEIRGGYTPPASSATGMTGNGKTLAIYNSLTGTNRMFCSTASGVYNVTSPGAVGSSVAARTNGKHIWVMFGDGSSNWLIMANGVDKPLYYDGTTWTAVDGITSPALTGLTTTKIVYVNSYKGRLFFLEKDSLTFWYLDAGVAGGALTAFDLSGEANKGGYLMSMATWTRDSGDGQDDVAVFMTSEGQAIVYQGNNPSSSTAWFKVGTFFIGKPLGRRCLSQYGGDLIILTENGAFPLSAALQSASIDYKQAISFKIENAFTEAARNYGANFGWEADILPAHSALIVNVPISEDGIHEQYVMNTITKAWCKFKDWNAECFAVFNRELYFATGTSVVKAWTGTIDGVNSIIAYGKTAFSNFGSNEIKKLEMFRPMLATNGTLQFLTDIDVDFGDDMISGVATYTVTNGAKWDVALWDNSYWAADFQVIKEWTSPDEWEGIWVSGKLKISTNSLTVQWISNDFMYQNGAGI